MDRSAMTLSFTAIRCFCNHRNFYLLSSFTISETSAQDWDLTKFIWQWKDNILNNYTCVNSLRNCMCVFHKKQKKNGKQQQQQKGGTPRYSCSGQKSWTFIPPPPVWRRPNCFFVQDRTCYVIFDLWNSWLFYLKSVLLNERLVI